MREKSYISAVATIVRGSAVPYGYTLTIWATGAALEHSRGSPNPGAIFLFIAGAVGAFAGVAFAVRGLRGQPLAMAPGDHARTGIVQLVAVGIAVGAAELISQIPSEASWPLGAFVATFAYLLLAALELVIVRETDDSDG